MQGRISHKAYRWDYFADVKSVYLQIWTLKDAKIINTSVTRFQMLCKPNVFTFFPIVYIVMNYKAIYLYIPQTNSKKD